MLFCLGFLTSKHSSSPQLLFHSSSKKLLEMKPVAIGLVFHTTRFSLMSLNRLSLLHKAQQRSSSKNVYTGTPMALYDSSASGNGHTTTEWLKTPYGRTTGACSASWNQWEALSFKQLLMIWHCNMCTLDKKLTFEMAQEAYDFQLKPSQSLTKNRKLSWLHLFSQASNLNTQA